MDEADKFLKNFEERQELWSRVKLSRRRDELALKARWEAKDPNVACTDYGDGDVRYTLEFTQAQRDALIAAYLRAANRPDAWQEHDKFNAKVFVGVLETWADGALDWQAIEPPKQKDRKRAIASFANALEKVDVALAALDRAAIGFLYGCIADRLAKEGIALSPADNMLVSMLDDPLRAQVEGGELRDLVRVIVRAVTEAAATADERLPPVDPEARDYRWKIAEWLEDRIVRDGLAFDTTETGFPAVCMRAVFDLAGFETEKMSYWLKKAEANPDSFANFLRRTREKIEGKNSDAV